MEREILLLLPYSPFPSHSRSFIAASFQTCLEYLVTLPSSLVPGWFSTTWGPALLPLLPLQTLVLWGLQDFIEEASGFLLATIWSHSVKAWGQKSVRKHHRGWGKEHLQSAARTDFLSSVRHQALCWVVSVPALHGSCLPMGNTTCSGSHTHTYPLSAQIRRLPPSLVSVAFPIADQSQLCPAAHRCPVATLLPFPTVDIFK